jgi:hypothetical protein
VRTTKGFARKSSQCQCQAKGAPELNLKLYEIMGRDSTNGVRKPAMKGRHV